MEFEVRSEGCEAATASSGASAATGSASIGACCANFKPRVIQSSSHTSLRSKHAPEVCFLQA